MSRVLNPRSKTSDTASSILFAAFSSFNPYLKSIAADRTAAMGFTVSCNSQCRHNYTATDIKRVVSHTVSCISRSKGNLPVVFRCRSMHRFENSRPLYPSIKDFTIKEKQKKKDMNYTAAY